jgi:hypothetical protein
VAQEDDVAERNQLTETLGMHLATVFDNCRQLANQEQVQIAYSICKHLEGIYPASACNTMPIYEKLLLLQHYNRQTTLFFNKPKSSNGKKLPQ